ncbi:MAG: hypothetical protein VX000_06875, partial [Myxococcota bacterium]|nr:hypothetical protein [Myxococcota bacterium]
AVERGQDAEEASNPDGEIVVFGELQVAARRAELDREIRQLGYRSGVRQDGRTVYRPDDPWKPTVIVFDDGFVRLKRSPVRFAPPGQTARSSRLRYLWCLPPFTPMCVRLGGQVVSNAKLEPQKARVVAATHLEVTAWREAIVKQAMTQKVGTELPNRLDELWANGRPLEGDGPLIVPWAERRLAMLAYWSDRTCTPEGDAVADAVALFLEYEVQESNHPVTAAEQHAANAAQHCSRRLDLVTQASP